MAPRRIRRVKVSSKMRGHLRRLAIRSGHGFIPDTFVLDQVSQQKEAQSPRFLVFVGSVPSGAAYCLTPCLELDIDPIKHCCFISFIGY